MSATHKMAIFGATGPTGLELLKQGLANGHKITCLARDPSKLEPYKHANLAVVQGNVLNKEDVEKIVEDQDRVIVSLGSRPGSKDSDVCSKGQAIINSCVLSNLPSSPAPSDTKKRMIVVSSLGAGDSYQHCNMFTKLLVKSFLSSAIADKNIQEESVQKDLAGKMDWIIVRPGGLTNGVVTNTYRVGKELGGGRVSRADVAHFILNKCLDGDEWNNKATTIVN
ncbi:hypothetical protein BKA69DRAFT_1067594 [Paraphysoderma sedebokerense]|nr:hypothetical protein BKA69DRAFT_1067594 [Paraphysoderma sedebokerense]